MSSQLNILLISNLFPTPVDPTRGIFTFQLARSLRTMCNLTVVCPLPWFPGWANIGFLKRWGEFSLIPNRYSLDGIDVHSPKYLMIPRLSEAVHATLMFPSLYRTVKQLHRKNAFDVVNTQWLYPDGVAATLTTRLLNLPHMLTALGCDANLFMKQGCKRSQIGWALRRAQGVTVVSNALKQSLVEEGFGYKPIDVIPNGVDAELFYSRNRTECMQQLGLAHKGKSIVFVGQLLQVKGVGYLIEAAEYLAAAGKEFYVYLVGEGSSRPWYEAEIERRGLTDRIRLVGPRPHSEIPLWMGSADVFCLPSIREGFPNVVLEALFSGRPVVASHVGGIPEMIDGNNGFLVEPMNSQLLAQALGRALERDWDPVSIVSSVSHLSWERAADLYLRSLTNSVKRFH